MPATIPTSGTTLALLVMAAFFEVDAEAADEEAVFVDDVDTDVEVVGEVVGEYTLKVFSVLYIYVLIYQI